MINLENPRMSDLEQSRLRSEMSLAKSYLEFGMGGSTLMAARSGIERIVSVDSDPQWVAAVKSHPEIASSVILGRVKALHADIGPVRDWGNPSNDTSFRRWTNYVGAGLRSFHEGEPPDLVFIDGRFRIACCLGVALAWCKWKKPIRIALHDVNEERPQYAKILDYYETVAHIESLLVAETKIDANWPDLVADLMASAFDYG